MTDASFEKIGRSDKCLYGPRKLLLCGFPIDAQPKFKMLLDMLGLKNLPLVWAGEKDNAARLAEIMERADGSGEGIDSGLPRAIILGGVAENELHRLMSGCHQAGMQKSLWATLTPTSEGWTLGALLAELAAENRAMAARTPKKK
jgi:hypothetical protein